MQWERWTYLLLLVGLLGACASNVPNEIRQAPAGSPPESVVREQLQQFIGSRVRWGGTIITVENRSNESWIEIVSRPLQANGRPDEDQAGGGRFLARYAGFLDPVIFVAGQLVTVTGIVEGDEERPIGEYRYKFPIVKIEAYYLWPPESLPVYPPSYWYDPYWHDPWWYDPWWPYPHHRYPLR